MKLTLNDLIRTCKPLGLQVEQVRKGSSGQYGDRLRISCKDWYPSVLAHEMSHAIGAKLGTPSSMHYFDRMKPFWGPPQTALAVRTEEAIADLVGELLTGQTREEVGRLRGSYRPWPPVTGKRARWYVAWYAAHIANRIFDAHIQSNREGVKQ